MKTLYESIFDDDQTHINKSNKTIEDYFKKVDFRYPRIAMLENPTNSILKDVGKRLKLKWDTGFRMYIDDTMSCIYIHKYMEDMHHMDIAIVVTHDYCNWPKDDELWKSAIKLDADDRDTQVNIASVVLNVIYSLIKDK